MLSVYIKKVKRIRIISPFLIRIIGVDLKLYTLRCCKMTQLSVRAQSRFIMTFRLRSMGQKKLDFNKQISGIKTKKHQPFD